MSDPRSDNDRVAQEPAGNGFESGQIAHPPFPDQVVRKTASAPHPRKRDANRDYKFLPRGSLATD